MWILSPFTLGAAEPAAENQPPSQAEPSSGEDLGYGVGSVLASMFYSPFKLTYAGLGLKDAAIREGATIVRIGTALFGERIKNA